MLIYQFLRFTGQIDTDISTDDYVDFDIQVTTAHGRLTTVDIIVEVTGTQEENEEDEENNDEEYEDIVTKPTNEEVRKAISVLEDFSLFSNFGEAMMRSLKDLNQTVEKDVLHTRKQTLTSDFFSSQE